LELPNLTMVNGDALYLISHYLPKQSVDGIHIYFPDPWPKRRHVKRRTFRTEPLNWILARIKPGGHLHIRTDVEGYFRHAMTLLSAASDVTSSETPESMLVHQTNFESKFRGRGLPIFHASFQIGNAPRVPDGLEPVDSDSVHSAESVK
jgi:tRNA (guanine-N7-)-methyltransferase